MRKRRKIRVADFLTYLVLILYAAYVLVPLAIMVMTSMKENLEFIQDPTGLPSQLFLDGFRTLFSDSQFFLYLKNSIFITGVSLVFAITFSVLLSYALARYTGCLLYTSSRTWVTPWPVRVTRCTASWPGTMG